MLIKKSNNKIGATMRTKNMISRLAMIVALVFAFNVVLLANIVLPSGGKDGSYWRPGSVQHISWDVLFVDTAKALDIYLWNGDSSTLTLIGSNIISSLGYYNWHIPGYQELGEHFKIRISYADTLSDFYLISKDFFPISNENMILNNNVFSLNTSDSVIVTLTPNPISQANTLNVESESEFFHIDIYGVLGHLLSSHTFNYVHTYSIDISNMSAGTYIVRIKFMGKYVDRQIVIN